LADSLAAVTVAAQVVHSPIRDSGSSPKHGKFFGVTEMLLLDFGFLQIFQIVDKIAYFLGN
jgi:hypothetical protein